MFTCLCVGMSYVYVSISSCPCAMCRCVYVSICHMSTCLPLCLYMSTALCACMSIRLYVYLWEWEHGGRCWGLAPLWMEAADGGEGLKPKRKASASKADVEAAEGGPPNDESAGACGADWGHRALSLAPSANSPPTWGPALARLPIPCTPAPAPRHTSPPPGCSRPRPPHTRHAPLPLPVAVGALVADSLGHLDPGALCSPLGKESPQGVGVPRWG